NQGRRLVRLDEAHGAVAVFGAAEDAGQGIIIAARDRIEFVIVAAGSGGGLAEEGLHGRVDLLVGYIQFILQAVAFVQIPRADFEEAGGDLVLALGLGILGRKLIAGELLLDELIERLVGIEGGDDIVAIAPGVGIVEVDGL